MATKHVFRREPKEVEHFDGAIRGGHGLGWDLADARANTLVLEAVHESLKRQAPVPIGR
jgi:hypothetical protein